MDELIFVALKINLQNKKNSSDLSLKNSLKFFPDTLEHNK
jgi:hypothetical protein